ncbi:MAG: phosphatidate cytidylyltransferase [Kordiimonadaceae bacterium]|nr:phosphatidate cytidylyltransferase [Kordiimonadaceae bacterium]MBO6570330.1 phosphatidate cytidylyltransferase [Kordiimonadaceae bacterium]MBO6965572.1 phosphatidate cytidylyltransferase [Kordiimonadaceae bacterium]
MPLGLSDNLFKRVVSALTLLPVVLGLIYLGGWYFFALLASGGFLMLREWFTLTDVSDRDRFVPYFAAVSLTAIVTANPNAISGAAIAIAMLLMSGVLLAHSPSKIARSSATGQSKMNAGAGAVYVTMALMSLAWLRAQDQDGLIVIWLFFAVWAMDVGGYFAGKGIGGPKLAPVISPKKTWAGLIGGMVLAALVSLAISLLFDLGDPLLMPFAAAIVAVIAQMGDLYESAIKRALDQKDSGNLIPGHGGILDRVDGLIFAAPAVAVALAIPELSQVSG